MPPDQVEIEHVVWQASGKLEAILHHSDFANCDVGRKNSGGLGREICSSKIERAIESRGPSVWLFRLGG